LHGYARKTTKPWCVSRSWNESSFAVGTTRIRGMCRNHFYGPLSLTVNYGRNILHKRAWHLTRYFGLEFGNIVTSMFIFLFGSDHAFKECLHEERQLFQS
jgi:hypothetical protein